MSPHHPLLRLASVLALFVSISLTAGAQCPEWSTAFPPDGVDGEVAALAVFDDGSGPELFVGGRFTRAGPLATSGIARWNGTTWSASGSGLGGSQLPSIRAFAVFDDGSGPALYAAGYFPTIDGVSVNHVARWDGTSWSALGTGVDASIATLAVFDDGSGPALYAGGALTLAGGVPVQRLARWDGTAWSAVGSGFGVVGPVPGLVHALAVHDDGSGAALYVGGTFSSASGVPANSIARFDGTTWTPLGSGFDGEAYVVTALGAFDDGAGSRLYASGEFLSSGSQSLARIARWDGSTWSWPGSGLDAPAWTFAVHDDGQGPAFHAGGFFSTADGAPTGGVARWNGSSWSVIASGSPGGQALASFDDGSGPRLYAGGLFSGAGDVSAHAIARLDAGSWRPLGEDFGLETRVTSLHVHDDDGSGPALIASGDFTSAGGVHAERIAKWDGDTWSPLGLGVGGSSPFLVHAMESFDDGSGSALYVTGRLLSAGGSPANRIARWQGGLWSALGSGLEGDQFPHGEALAVFDDGKGPELYVGGRFATAGGVPALRIARWSGSAWSSVGNADAPVSALAVFDDGTGTALYAGGVFTSIGGVPASRIARWDGSTWSTLASGIGGIGSAVSSLAVFDDGTGPALYVGGEFAVAGGVSVHNVARWNGTSWSAVGTGLTGNDPVVRVLTVFDAGAGPRLFAGGRFEPNSSRECLAVWDGASWTALGDGLEYPFAGDDVDVHALAVFDADSGPSLFVGGVFALAGGVQSLNFGAWNGCEEMGEFVCLGDGTGSACPCANVGLPGHGCDNSAATGGARLEATGWPSLAFDSLELSATDELSSALSIFLQGNALVAPSPFGDGLRCAGGSLKRLYVRNAVAGSVTAPLVAEPSVSGRSAALGDPIAIGESRVYQTYYRDPDLAFCPAPLGNAWNVTNGLRIGWGP